MELLSSNLNRKPLHFSSISANLRKPSSPPLLLLPNSCLNRRLSLRLRLPLKYSWQKAASTFTTSNSETLSAIDEWIGSLGKGLFEFTAAAMFSICCDSPALVKSLIVAFPVSRAPEVNKVQRTLVEAWGLIRETFVDSTFNHQDWDLKLQQTMVEMFPLDSADASYTKISAMLSTLGDPFTWIISPKEYQSFRIRSDGNLQGVGLFISIEPKTSHLVVLSSVENGCSCWHIRWRKLVEINEIFSGLCVILTMENHFVIILNHSTLFASQ